MSIDVSTAAVAVPMDSKSAKQTLLNESEDLITQANQVKTLVEDAFHVWDKAITSPTRKENEYIPAQQAALKEFENFKEILNKAKEFINNCEPFFDKLNAKFFGLQTQYNYALVKVRSFERLKVYLLGMNN